MIDPKFIAKLLTEDPDVFNEGWEELGIEDPSISEPTESSALTALELIRNIQSFFNVQYPQTKFNLMPPKKVSNIQNFLRASVHPFSLFIAENALDEMEEERAAAFFPGFSEVVKNSGWVTYPDIIHDDEAGRLVLMILPPGFVL